MTKSDLQTWLYKSIPAAALLDITVEECSHEQVVLKMRSASEENVFCGSISFAATACGRALTRFNDATNVKMLLQQSQTHYLSAATGDLTLITRTPSSAQWTAMWEMFTQRGKGRITLETEIYAQQKLVVVFSARYSVQAG